MFCLRKTCSWMKCHCNESKGAVIPVCSSYFYLIALFVSIAYLTEVLLMCLVWSLETVFMLGSPKLAQSDHGPQFNKILFQGPQSFKNFASR